MFVLGYHHHRNAAPRGRGVFSTILDCPEGPFLGGKDSDPDIMDKIEPISFL